MNNQPPCPICTSKEITYTSLGNLPSQPVCANSDCNFPCLSLIPSDNRYVAVIAWGQKRVDFIRELRSASSNRTNSIRSWKPQRVEPSLPETFSTSSGTNQAQQSILSLSQELEQMKREREAWKTREEELNEKIHGLQRDNQQLQQSNDELNRNYQLLQQQLQQLKTSHFPNSSPPNSPVEKAQEEIDQLTLRQLEEKLSDLSSNLKLELKKNLSGLESSLRLELEKLSLRILAVENQATNLQDQDQVLRDSESTQEGSSLSSKEISSAQYDNKEESKIFQVEQNKYPLPEWLGTYYSNPETLKGKSRVVAISQDSLRQGWVGKSGVTTFKEDNNGSLWVVPGSDADPSSFYYLVPKAHHKFNTHTLDSLKMCFDPISETETTPGIPSGLIVYQPAIVHWNAEAEQWQLEERGKLSGLNE